MRNLSLFFFIICKQVTQDQLTQTMRFWDAQLEIASWFKDVDRWRSLCLQSPSVFRVQVELIRVRDCTKPTVIWGNTLERSYITRHLSFEKNCPSKNNTTFVFFLFFTIVVNYNLGDKSTKKPALSKMLWKNAKVFRREYHVHFQNDEGRTLVRWIATHMCKL